jgi:hypothetical protein
VKTYKKFAKEHPARQDTRTGYWGFHRHGQGFDLSRASFATKREAEKARQFQWKQDVAVEKAATAGRDPRYDRSVVHWGAKLQKLVHRENPASIRAQVRRLPSGQIQLKIPIGKSENPHSVIEQLKRVFGKRVKAVEMTGGKRNPNWALSRQYEHEAELGTIRRTSDGSNYHLRADNGERRKISIGRAQTIWANKGWPKAGKNMALWHEAVPDKS